jgi:4-diphosphocytidyl-2-C-methyl-D-erythritol kinase
VTLRAARVTAHAKINLILRVLARESSGFHTLETLFARLAIGDTITVRITSSGRSLECDANIPGPTEENLAYRAALAFTESTGWPSGFAIEIEKRIPVGGGLGGGSADAGAVLRALSALSPHPVKEAQLLAIGAALGSDVPYVTTAAPLALAWARGDRLLALPPLTEREVVLVLPGFAVSTAAAYAWLAASRAGTQGSASLDADTTASDPALRDRPPSPALASPQLLSLADLATWSSVASLATNDFEPVVSTHYPAITTTLSGLRAAGASIALMSGSGSTVFGIFDSRPPAAALDSALPGNVVLTHTLSTVPPVEIIS